MFCNKSLLLILYKIIRPINTEKDQLIISDLFQVRYEKNKLKLEDVSIKVENINASLLLFSGKNDKI